MTPSETSQGDSRRAYARVPYVRNGVLVRNISGDGAGSTHQMSTRDLSAAGMGLVFFSAMRAGTRLEIVLTRRDGVETPIEGTVVHSTPSSGNHFIGVQFNGL